MRRAASWRPCRRDGAGAGKRRQQGQGGGAASASARSGSGCRERNLNQTHHRNRRSKSKESWCRSERKEKGKRNRSFERTGRGWTATAVRGDCHVGLCLPHLQLRRRLPPLDRAPVPRRLRRRLRGAPLPRRRARPWSRLVQAPADRRSDTARCFLVEDNVGSNITHHVACRHAPFRLRQHPPRRPHRHPASLQRRGRVARRHAPVRVDEAECAGAGTRERVGCEWAEGQWVAGQLG